MLDALLEDDRITAVGLLVETLEDAPALATAARKARERRIPLVACKLGRSEEGARLTVSHTASLAGSERSAAAFFKRTGIARAHSLPAFLETLKLLHTTGPLAGRDIASLSCSGGEAALMADAIDERRLRARPLTGRERERVGATLNDLVTISNPLDYHTFIWGDAERLTDTFAAMLGCGFDLGLLVIDPPRRDRCTDDDWHITLDAFEAALHRTGAHGCVLTTLPESFPEALCENLMARGIAPMAGVEDGLAAVEAAADIGESWAAVDRIELEGPRPFAGGGSHEVVLTEWEAKRRLAEAGVTVPPGELVRNPEDAAVAAERLGTPVAIKAVGRGLTHKSEKGAVRLGLKTPAAIEAAARALLPLGDRLLVERMVGDGVGEVIVGVSRDAQVGLVLLVGSGGELVELAGDRVVLLLPASRAEIEAAVAELKVATLIAGFRRPAGGRSGGAHRRGARHPAVRPRSRRPPGRARRQPPDRAPGRARRGGGGRPHANGRRRPHMTTPDFLHVTRRGAVLEVILDRPKANAIDGAASRRMGELFAGFRDDPELRVAVITGAGERFFSAGWDLKGAAEGEPPDTDYGAGGFGGLQELPGLDKPVIAAVNGMAVGGGLELAISCDLILAAEHARFALPEINVGVLADAASIKLHRRIPFHVSMDLLLTGPLDGGGGGGTLGTRQRSAAGRMPDGARPRDRRSPRRRAAARLRRHQGDHPHDGEPQDRGGVPADARQGHPRGEYPLCERGPRGRHPRLRREAPARLEGTLSRGPPRVALLVPGHDRLDDDFGQIHAGRGPRGPGSTDGGQQGPTGDRREPPQGRRDAVGEQRPPALPFPNRRTRGRILHSASHVTHLHVVRAHVVCTK